LVKFKKLIGKNNQGGEEFKGQQIMPCILIFYLDFFYEKFAKYSMIHLGCHPGAELQYTFTYKQYIERHKTNNTYKNTTISEECGPCPGLASYTLAFALQPRKKQYVKIDLTVISSLVTTWNGVPYYVSPVRT
jgi:hypothetical protein